MIDQRKLYALYYTRIPSQLNKVRSRIKALLVAAVLYALVITQALVEKAIS